MTKRNPCNGVHDRANVSDNVERGFLVCLACKVRVAAMGSDFHRKWLADQGITMVERLMTGTSLDGKPMIDEYMSVDMIIECRRLFQGRDKDIAAPEAVRRLAFYFCRSEHNIRRALYGVGVFEDGAGI